jgi:hypothetical protein
VRAWSEWNFDKKYNDLSDDQFDGWFDQRFRLTITHTRSEYLKAVVRIDLVEDTWGQGRAMYINGSNTGEYINWAYIDFTLPSIGNFRVGKFPVTWGHGLTLSQENPAPEGIEWSNAWGPVSLTLLYIKNSDKVITGLGTGTYNQDGNFFGAKIAYTPMENHLIELFGGYYTDGDFTLVNGFWAPLGWPNIEVDVGFVALAYTGNFADMIDVMFEGAYLFGDADHAILGDMDVKGWHIYLDVSYYNDLFRLGVAFLMKSGEEDFIINGGNDWNLACFSDEAFAWANIIGNDGGGANSIYGEWWTGDGLENITSVKLYFEICPMDKLTINAAVIWAKFTEDVGIGSWYRHPADYYGNWAGVYSIVNDDDLGWEIDLGFTYEIMEGLTYTFAGGVLFTGDAWDYFDGAGPEDWGTIWSISNTLLYEF